MLSIIFYEAEMSVYLSKFHNLSCNCAIEDGHNGKISIYYQINVNPKKEKKKERNSLVLDNLNHSP